MGVDRRPFGGGRRDEDDGWCGCGVRSVSRETGSPGRSEVFHRLFVKLCIARFPQAVCTSDIHRLRQVIHRPLKSVFHVKPRSN
jgi:hypothetical protein